MQLLTNEIEKALPPLRSTISEKDPMVHVKFFDPYSGWEWYAIEGSRLDSGEFTILNGKKYPNDMTFYGLVVGFEKELGYFSLVELESIKHYWQIPRIERDLYFEPMRLIELKKKLINL